MRGHPVHAGDDIGAEPCAIAIIDPDAVQPDPLGDAVRGATDHARHDRAGAETVGADSASEVVYVVRPALELGVRRPDPGVNDVHVHADAR